MRAARQRQQLQVVAAATTLLLAACLHAACAGGVEDAPPAGVAATDASVTAAADTLELRLDAPAEIPAGGTVELRVVARNVAGRALDLYLRGRVIAFDVSAETAGGSVVWSRLHDEIVPAILRLATLAPGDSLVLAHEWDQRANTGAPVPPGEYILRGLLLTEGEPLRTPPRTLRITAPR